MAPLVFLDTKTHFLIQDIFYTWKKLGIWVILHLDKVLAAHAEDLSSDPCVCVRSQALAWHGVSYLSMYLGGKRRHFSGVKDQPGLHGQPKSHTETPYKITKIK